MPTWLIVLFVVVFALLAVAAVLLRRERARTARHAAAMSGLIERARPKEEE